MFPSWIHQLAKSAGGAGALAAALALAGCGASHANRDALAPAGPEPTSARDRPPREPLPADIVERSALPLYALAGEPFAVGFEMFQAPYQPALTSFVTGDASEAQFLEGSQYRERWGFDFALYRPLLEAARAQRLSALALNAPRELTRKISRNGLASLDAAERTQLPELDLSNPEHRAYFDAAMQGHPMPEGAPRMEDMYAVQVVWDETMAENAARWLGTAGPGSRLVIFAGSGHCHQSAIPGRLGRRLNEPVLSTTAVLASKLGELEARERYDWLLVLDDAGPATP
jgi:uncharacterized iron-regulated protein